VALLILSGCGQESEDTASEPEAITPTTSQSIGSGNTASDPEANAATEQPNEPDESEQATKARLDDLMAKVNERLDLSEDQETQIRAIMQEYLLTMEEQMEARRAQFAGQGTPGSQRGAHAKGPHTEGDRPEMTDEMMGMMQKQEGQQESLNAEIQEILTPEQVEEFQKILDELRREMILQQTIEQMGGENTSPDDK
jgi:small-conductance mechanosensitive channel